MTSLAEVIISDMSLYQTQYHKSDLSTYRHECVVQPLRPVNWRHVAKSRPVDKVSLPFTQNTI